MAVFSVPARGFAAGLALCAWVGLAAQVEASIGLTGSFASAIWAMLRYFTVLTNLGLAVVFTGIACGRPGFGAASLLGGVTLSILLVGIIYGVLLRDLLVLSGGAKLADLLLHHVTPILAPLFWLAYAPRGGLRAIDPWLWSVFPLGYFAYALIRGSLDGNYAYPFMNVAKIGLAQTAANGAIIGAAFVVVGYVALWIDRRLSRQAAVRRGPAG